MVLLVEEDLEGTGILMPSSQVRKAMEILGRERAPLDGAEEGEGARPAVGETEGEVVEEEAGEVRIWSPVMLDSQNRSLQIPHLTSLRYQQVRNQSWEDTRLWTQQTRRCNLLLFMGQVGQTK